MNPPSKWSFVGGRTMLPRRLQRPKLGVQTPVQKVWPRHRRWVRSHGCCVPDCPAVQVDFAHLRSAANAGKGQKPHDAFGVSLCRDHHIEQHALGAASFGQKYGIDPWALAREFLRRTPDLRMRLSLALPREQASPNAVIADTEPGDMANEPGPLPAPGAAALPASAPVRAELSTG
jgi:hypothetical protein